MSTTIGNLKTLVSTYLGRDDVADLTINGFDVGLFALNAASRKLQRITDLVYAQDNGALSIAAGGTLITAVTGLIADATVKRIKTVELPVADGYIPIEFLTDEEYRARVRRQLGRSAYSPSSNLASLGVSDANPYAYQLGQKIFLAPASQFTFPLAARVNVVQFMPDYTDDADTDFLCVWAPEYLQWTATLEVNKFYKRYAPKQEGGIDEEAVKAMADEALQTVLAWNASLTQSTSTPPSQ